MEDAPTRNSLSVEGSDFFFFFFFIYTIISFLEHGFFDSDDIPLQWRDCLLCIGWRETPETGCEKMARKRGSVWPKSKNRNPNKKSVIAAGRGVLPDG
jgi:hypothetical protein